MFYVSRATPLFFILASVGLFLSLLGRSRGYPSLEFLFPLIYCFLGFTLMGAMYQIVPNSQSRRLAGARFSYLSLLMGAFSVVFFLSGREVLSFLLYLSASAVFFVQILLTVRNWTPPTVRFLGFSATMLFLSSLFLFIHALGYLGVQVAIHTLTVGSMLSAIYGVEGAWIPMLTMETLSLVSFRRLFYFKVLSSLILIAGFGLYQRWLILAGGILELAVFVVFLSLMLGILRRRRSPAPVPPVVKVFILALSFLPLGIPLALAMAVFPGMIPLLAPLHLNFMAFGLGAITIVGGMSHLLPRILWQAMRGKPVGERLSIGDLSIDRYVFPLAVLGALLLLLVSALELTGIERTGDIILALSFGAFYAILFSKPIIAIGRVRNG